MKNKSNALIVKIDALPLKYLKPTVDFIIYDLLQNESDREVIFEWFPKLRRVSKLCADKTNSNVCIEHKTRDFFENLFEKTKTTRHKLVPHIYKLWQNLEKPVFLEYSKLLELEQIPFKANQIRGFVGINPFNPRNVQDLYFEIFYKQFFFKNANQRVIDIVMHETFHFFWFYKFKQVMPKIPENQYDYPYPAWQLSEIVIDIFLNQPSVKDAVKSIIPSDYKFSAYPEYYKPIKHYSGNSIVDLIAKLYAKSSSIDDFIKQAYSLVEKVYGK